MAFPVGERSIAAAEAVLGRRLPAPLRARPVRASGGAAQGAGNCRALFPIEDRSDRRRLARGCGQMVAETAAAGAIAPGSNGCADRLVLRPGSDEPEALGHATGRLEPERTDRNR